MEQKYRNTPTKQRQKMKVDTIKHINGHGFDNANYVTNTTTHKWLASVST